MMELSDQNCAFLDISDLSVETTKSDSTLVVIPALELDILNHVRPYQAFFPFREAGIISYDSSA
jgi:hypothetical protein